MPDSPNSTGWCGLVELHYANRHANPLLEETVCQNRVQTELSNRVQTTVSHSYAQAPLRLQQSFYPEGPEVCQTVIVHTAGGMVGGDRLRVKLQLDPGTRALLTTAAASKIYRSSGPESCQEIEATVSAGACLEWFPQETIVFNQARYRQVNRITLEPGGQWLGWEITRLGRTAQGETFVAGDWRSRTEVWQNGQPLWIDRQWLPASAEIWASAHGLAQSPIVATFAWVGIEVNSDFVSQVRQLWQAQVEALSVDALSVDAQTRAEAHRCAGVSRLEQGLVCRYRGHDRAAVQRWFVAVWRLIRARQWGKSPPLPRVWQSA